MRSVYLLDTFSSLSICFILFVCVSSLVRRIVYPSSKILDHQYSFRMSRNNKKHSKMVYSVFFACSPAIPLSSSIYILMKYKRIDIFLCIVATRYVYTGVIIWEFFFVCFALRLNERNAANKNSRKDHTFEFWQKYRAENNFSAFVITSCSHLDVSNGRSDVPRAVIFSPVFIRIFGLLILAR